MTWQLFLFMFFVMIAIIWMYHQTVKEILAEKKKVDEAEFEIPNLIKAEGHKNIFGKTFINFKGDKNA